ncbi:MAG: carbamoyltransferase HypF [Kiritimatiellae bacterium]|nr:carbamoyltransferase HypF [Kiritimatiellia bacterium]
MQARKRCNSLLEELRDVSPGGSVRVVANVYGAVQGVGFRPTVHRLAVEAGLGGSVRNRSDCVRLELKGPAGAVGDLLARLPAALPALARVDGIRVVKRVPLDVARAPGPFRIRSSSTGRAAHVAIPADVAACPECLADVYDPANRRYGYPFTTCTRCGPRYTVVRAMPYDRARTTLARFPLCPVCRAEYDNPADRRFHAESIACPVCGPRIALLDAGGRPVEGDPLREARAALAAGRIVAIRGIGGFLLAVDAFDRAAVSELRRRKRRPHKPFAVMAAGPETVRRYCRVSPPALELVRSARAPIVILDTNASPAGRELPLDLLTPDAGTLGVMLPNSPMHKLLFDPLDGDPVPAFDLLVMTSGNRRGEPICTGNDEALARLVGVADLFLVHDREIALRNDDSLCVLRAGRPQVWRRARGYAPDPVRLAAPLARAVLALGAEYRNAIALGRGAEVVLSPHVGDLDTPEAADGLEQAADRLPRFLEHEVAIVAVDRHPDMASTRLGVRLAAERGVPLVRVQHHHAHAVACMAEHGLCEALALVFDGTGLGTDGTIWGAECLHVAPGGYTRLATFEPAPLPGGDAAVRRPARQLVGRWEQAGVAVAPDRLSRLGVSERERAVWTAQAARGLNAPLSHAAGRLLDSMAAALGLAPERVTYDGQPAVRLEAAARRCTHGMARAALPFRCVERAGMLRVDWTESFRRLEEPAGGYADACCAAAAVHEAVARAAVAMVRYALDRVRVRTLVLSGGVFMNGILADRLANDPALNALDLRLHRAVPPNDGGVALGQAVVAGSGPAPAGWDPAKR